MTPIEPRLPESIRRIANAEDRRLAWEFFVFFSRFEYALKRDSRYLRSGIDNAEPNWDRFASDHSERFCNDPANVPSGAVSYFLTNPPRKQLQANGEMLWSEPLRWDEREPQLIWLLRVLRTVRNNLFHGGKFPVIPMAEPSRDHDLLVFAINILAACLSLDPRVEELFADGIELEET